MTRPEDSAPQTGDPAIDEAIRQTFVNLTEIRDAHGTGETPVDGTYYTEAAKAALDIRDGIEQVARSAAAHWGGQSGEMYQALNRTLAQ